MTKPNRSVRTAPKSARLTLVPPASAPFVPISPPPAHQHPGEVYLARLSQSSRRSQRSALRKIAELASSGRCTFETMPWAQLRHEHVAAIRAYLSDHFAPSTGKRQMAALRGVINSAWRLGQMSTEDRARALDVGPIRGESLPTGRSLRASEKRAVFEVCEDDETITGVRDAAILSVAFATGLRRTELVSLDFADYTPSTGALRVRRGKGNKQRDCYLGESGKAALEFWLEFRGKKAGPMFFPLSRGGRILRVNHRGQPRRISDVTFAVICKRRAEEARIDPFSPHDCRRTFITELLEAGEDISVVSKMAGHASVTTTAKYDRRGEAAKQRAAEKILIPFRRPKWAR